MMLLKQTIRLIVFILSVSTIFARPYLKIQQVRLKNFPQVQVELSVAKITPVQNLNSSHFELYENDWRVGSFQLRSSAQSQEGRKMVLLVDSSKSITPDKFRRQLEAVRSFVSALGANDLISVVSFNDKVETQCDFTSNIANLTTCVARIRQNGFKTLLYDSILEAITQARSNSRRSSVLVFTDGKDEGSIIELNDLISRSQTMSIPIFVIGTGEKKKLRPLARLSRLSGGETFHSANDADLKNIYLLLNQLLENTYIIRYVSEASRSSVDGAVNLRVKLKADSTLTFQDEDSYRFTLPKRFQVSWYQKIVKDDRVLLFLMGLIVFLVLLIVLALILRRPDKNIIIANASDEEEVDAEKGELYEKRFANSQSNTSQRYKKKISYEHAEKKSIRDQAIIPLEYYQAYLIEKEGPNTGKKHKIHWSSVVIGHSDECSIVIEDKTMSMRHAKIVRSKGHFILFDLLSEHGVFINNKKMLRPKELNDFDEIQLGRTRLIFRKVSGKH